MRPALASVMTCAVRAKAAPFARRVAGVGAGFGTAAFVVPKLGAESCPDPESIKPWQVPFEGELGTIEQIYAHGRNAYNNPLQSGEVVFEILSKSD